MPRRSRWFRQLLFRAPAVILALNGPGADAGGSDVFELTVKAAFLYKFASFTRWPSQQAEFPSGNFVICVIGTDPFRGLLERTAAGHTVDGHPIVVRQYSTITGDPGCSEAYVAGSPEQPQAEAMAALDGATVLTVTDGAYSPQVGGVIQLVSQDGHLRFTIDNREAALHHLRFSSKLLSLSVKPHPPPD